MKLGRAIDLYIGDLARRARSVATRRSYRRLLNDFADVVGDERDVSTLRLEDYERFLDRWVDASPATLASGVSLVKGFARFLFERGTSSGGTPR